MSQGKLPAKYAVWPGNVISQHDGQRHFIGAMQIAKLYGVDWRECVVVTTRDRLEDIRTGSLIDLHPRQDGNYSLEDLSDGHGK